MKSLALKSLLSVFFLSGTFLPASAVAADAWPPTTKQKTYRVKKKSAELARASTPVGSPSLAVNVVSAGESKPATPLTIPPSTVRVPEPSKRILNIRLHPITLLEMATHQNTRVSLRGDLLNGIHHSESLTIMNCPDNFPGASNLDPPYGVRN